MASVSIRMGLAALVVMGGAPLARAQPYSPDYDQAQRDYEQQQEQYQQQRDDQEQDQERYDDAQSRYQDQRGDYDAQREAYARAHGRYERDRAAYDEEYGAGAWERYYGRHPDAYDARYGPGAYERDFGAPAAHDDEDAYAPYRGSACEEQRTGAGLVGGVIGALAGGAIGSAVGNGAGGAVAAGAVLGGAVGFGVGRSTADCDRYGYYFSYDQTYPYREGEQERGPSGDHDYDWYLSHRCRLAPAPATVEDRTEYRWVRVCPDGDGRYRITG